MVSLSKRQSEEAVTLGHVLLTVHKINKNEAQIPTQTRRSELSLALRCRVQFPGREAVGAALLLRTRRLRVKCK